MISNLKVITSIPFKSNLQAEKPDIKPRNFDEIPSLNNKYTQADQVKKTVTILGSSKTSEKLSEAMKKAGIIANELIKRGYNVLTGCGNSGIMGSAYNGAHEAEANASKEGLKSGENLAIVVTPPWGDENLKDCRAIGIADTEAERTAKFQKASDNFLVFPGSAATLQEATTLITEKVYPKKGSTPKNIFLIGKKYFAGLKKQYDDIYKAGLLKVKPEELFKVVDSENEVLNNFPDLNKKSE